MTGRHEAPAVGSAAARMVRALVRRAGEGDTEALEQLRMLDELTTQAVSTALRRMHDEAGYSWAELARVTGTTRQACSQRAAVA
jgi:hypothetical protein